MEVRPIHLAEAARDKEAGTQCPSHALQRPEVEADEVLQYKETHFCLNRDLSNPSGNWRKERSISVEAI